MANTQAWAVAGAVGLLAVLIYSFGIRRLPHRSRSRVLLASFVVITLGIAYYFTAVDPMVQKLNQGLDLQGGIHVVLQAVETKENPVDAMAMQKAVDIIRNRVDRLGVSEPVIQESSGNRIVVELPGVKDAQQALDVIGRTALLEFIDEQGQVIFTGKDLVKADVSTQNNQPVVAIELNAAGTQRFADATSRNIGRRILISLDGEVFSAPVVNEAIPNGRAVIQGYQDIKEAYKISVMLSSGALPVSLEIIENRTVSATLGQDSVQASKLAAMIGIAAVMVFMMAFYRVPGALASYALGVYIFVVVTALWLLKATLTLPGVAGIVLGVGMAVDANCIIFERIREEVRTGRTLRSAIDAGFKNAMRTVIDSNVTTIIAAVVLYYLGTGPIRGFAVTLTVSILASMLTAVVVTHWLLRQSVDSGVLMASGALFDFEGGADK